jgi:RNA polymerase sigma-70 factor, ECF subfamily
VDFYEIYDLYYDRIKHFILGSVRNHWVADDLVQETFIRVLQNFSQVRDQTKLSSWIFRIAANLCHDYFRGNSKTMVLFEDNLNELSDEISLEKEVERYQISLMVQDLIKLLPEPMRQVIFLCDIKQESYQEVADSLGISLENVKIRLHRARKQLKAIVEKKGQIEKEVRMCLHS